MTNRFTGTDYILWSLIVVYTGIIYATLSIVSKVRKFLVETYGDTVFDHIYWFFGIIGVALLFFCFRKYKGRQLLVKLLIFAIFTGIYAYYLSGMKYAIERIHFLEYGLLGVLVYIAFTRHISHWITVILSLHVVYWIGLGDEAIQGMLVNRVGEIRDSIINLFSGILGVMLWWFITEASRMQGKIKPGVIKTALIFLGGSTIFTALFIYTVHGFGYCIENMKSGRMYSSFSKEELSEINSYSQKISPRELAVYENEAQRHLFQREFYFTNDFKARDGSYYRAYANCLYENRILEYYYKRYVDEHTEDRSGPLIRHIGRDVAKKVDQNPVVWSDSLRTWMEETYKENTWLYSSRVKSRIVTSYPLKDLLFFCLLILLVLGYVWFRVSKQE